MIDKRELQKLYINKKMGYQKIGKEKNIPASQIYRLLKKYNIPIRNPGGVKNARSNHWKGGKHKDHYGYIKVWCSNRKKYIYEHRLIMENKVGCFLTSKEVVHHKNGNKEDNRIENLSLCKDASDHAKRKHGIAKAHTKNGKSLQSLYESGRDWDEIASEFKDILL